MVTLTMSAIVLCAIAAVVFVFRGGEDPSAREASPEEYMKDPEFRAAIEERGKIRDELLATRSRLEKERAAMLAGRDEKSLRADPAWIDVNNRLEDIRKALTDNRRKMIGIVHDRMNPKGKDLK